MIIVLLVLFQTPLSFGQITPCTPGGKLLDFFQIGNCDPNSLCHVNAGSTVTATATYTPSAALNSVPIAQILKNSLGLVVSIVNYEGCSYAACPLVANVAVTVSISYFVPLLTPRGQYTLQCEVNTVDNICFTLPVEVD